MTQYNKIANVLTLTLSRQLSYCVTNKSLGGLGVASDEPHYVRSTEWLLRSVGPFTSNLSGWKLQPALRSNREWVTSMMAPWRKQLDAKLLGAIQ